MKTLGVMNCWRALTRIESDSREGICRDGYYVLEGGKYLSLCIFLTGICRFCLETNPPAASHSRREVIQRITLLLNRFAKFFDAI